MGDRTRVVLGLAVYCLSLAPASALAERSEGRYVPPQSELCSRTPADFQRMLFDPRHRLAFANDGGLLDGGVCWWHSRFQRSAIYLALFRPDLPRPTEDEAFWISHELTRMEAVVVVPGYANLYEFSRDFRDVIQERLEFWQAWDGFLNQAWVKGLAGGTRVPAARLAKRMDRLYREVELERRIVFQKLQLKGIAAHGWLVAGMERIPNGYLLKVVDSNAPRATRSFVYRRGDTQLYSPSMGEYFVPYRDYSRDLKRIARAIRAYCGRG